MRKQIINKAKFKYLTPSLTTEKIKNLQQILTSENLENRRYLAELGSGETRFQILYLLSHYGSLCVGDISGILRANISGVSHQLRLLRKASLVKTKKRERIVFYSLAAEIPEIVELIIK